MIFIFFLFQFITEILLTLIFFLSFFNIIYKNYILLFIIDLLPIYYRFYFFLFQFITEIILIFIFSLSFFNIICKKPISDLFPKCFYSLTIITNLLSIYC